MAETNPTAPRAASTRENPEETVTHDGEQRRAPMIALFTDFGVAGPYTGQVKAVLHLAAPDLAVVDLFADAPSCDPRAASYLLAAYCHWFPPRTVFLARDRSVRPP